MIININREPKYSLYYIGSIILEELERNISISIETLFTKISSRIDENLHIDFLYYSLDWLYILSLVRVEGDRVEQC